MKFTEFLAEEAQQTLVEAQLDEMANLNPEDTGLAYVIWIGEIGGQHGPHIKVSNIKGKFAKGDCFVLSIAKNPVNLTPKFTKIPKEDVENTMDWITHNYDKLIALWKMYETGEGNSIELLTALEKV
jgi:hypothetical protein